MLLENVGELVSVVEKRLQRQAKTKDRINEVGKRYEIYNHIPAIK
jgi:hypothetical protein